MKNQYFGDVNDYRKYTLLRGVANRSGLSLGVCWMLTPDDSRTDGQKRAYLRAPEDWRPHDPKLFDALTRLNNTRVRRSVQQAAAWRLLPRATYFNALLADAPQERDAYFAAAWRVLRARPVLFFDPDNGIEVASVPRGAKGSSKYIYWSELREAWERGHSLVVYQHYPRVERQRFRRALRRRLRARLPGAIVSARATPHVLFLIAAQRRHARAGLGV